MGSNVEVGAVISDLESEYERSKRFLEELYRSLGTNRPVPGEPAVSERPPEHSIRREDKDARPEENTSVDPFEPFTLTREDSGLSNCSDYSASVPHLPELRTDGRSPAALISPGIRTSLQRREDAPSAPPSLPSPAPPTPSTPWRKQSLMGAPRKPQTLLVSCPVMEITDEDDSAPHSASAGANADAGNLQRRASNAFYGMPNVFASLDSLQIAQVLAPTPTAVPTGRHRRSSLDFVPAPPAHMRKWYESNVGPGNLPSPVSSTGQLETMSSRPSQQQQQPSKTRSLEVMGSQPVANPLQVTASRPPHAGAPATFRRSPAVSSSYNPSTNTNTTNNNAAINSTNPALYSGSNSTSNNSSHHHSASLSASGSGLQPTPPPQQQQPAMGHHLPEQHHLPMTMALESPTPPSTFTAATAHLARGHVDSGPMSAGQSGSLSSVSSPNLLPPLLPSPGPGPSPSPANTSPLAAIAARSAHSSVELGGRGSWSGTPLAPGVPLTAAGGMQVPPEFLEHSPRDRPRAGRFTRCGPSPPNLSPQGGAGTATSAVHASSLGSSGSSSGNVNLPPSLMLSPTPPSGGRERRPLAGDLPEKAMARTHSLLTATVLKSAAPLPGRSTSSFRTNSRTSTLDGARPTADAHRLMDGAASSGGGGAGGGGANRDSGSGQSGWEAPAGERQTTLPGSVGTGGGAGMVLSASAVVPSSGHGSVHGSHYGPGPNSGPSSGSSLSGPLHGPSGNRLDVRVRSLGGALAH